MRRWFLSWNSQDLALVQRPTERLLDIASQDEFGVVSPEQPAERPRTAFAMAKKTGWFVSTREEFMRGMLVAILVLAATPAIAEEKLSAVDLSARTAMTFKVNDGALQKLLPAGFAMNPPAE